MAVYNLTATRACVGLSNSIGSSSLSLARPVHIRQDGEQSGREAAFKYLSKLRSAGRVEGTLPSFVERATLTAPSCDQMERDFRSGQIRGFFAALEDALLGSDPCAKFTDTSALLCGGLTASFGGDHA